MATTRRRCRRGSGGGEQLSLRLLSLLVGGGPGGGREVGDARLGPAVGEPLERVAQVATGRNTIAQNAASANPSIKTFVIGVVDMGDFVSTNNLNALAKAGGTDAALIVKPNQDMAAQFSTALEKIKGKAVGCEFKIPTPDAGKVDPAKVNVVYKVNGGAEQKIYKVNDAASCDATIGGWYYDKLPDPTAIILCPATCAVVQTPSQKVEVSIQLGCQTWAPPPK